MPINVPALIIPAGGNPNRDRTQTIPGEAPAGEYTYYAFIGDYPWFVKYYHLFIFTKEGGDNDGFVIDQSRWICTGEDFPGEQSSFSDTPNECCLLSTFPNPFNPSTELTYSLQSSGEVSLTIFDITGCEVFMLLDGYELAGTHSITWNAEQFPSGIYFARLTSENGQTQTQKLVLMK